MRSHTFAAEHFPAGLVEAIGKFENLMEEKRQKCQQVEVETQVLGAVTVVVFDMVALIF